ncbi:glycoside hydrolase family 9 protein [Pluteus cervinus]|uniref:Glycoside hydrolase family 9 protein n=1 Tax=Pluteus cervinus TaxID=181527 RepID=A0ACD3BCH7_9AGAR|nr:glycoside hydrolase family 9 protein [Pluteus cervinus]
MKISIISSLFAISPVFAQLALPQPPYLPPNATAGTVPTNSTNRPNTQWSNLIGNLLYFYEAQRSGKLPPTNRVPWRNSSAVDDGRDVKLDLSGGYYDAGDYIKCTYPLTFTITSLCWGAIDNGLGYDMSNQTAYLDDMLRWGLDWLMRAHPENSTLYVQVGDANIDNNYWGGDNDIPQPRPSFQINDTSPGTDAAASASAAFSACAAMYANRGFNGKYAQQTASLRNSTYASTLLTHAHALYTFAVKASGGMKTYQSSVPQVGDAYASSSYGDDLVLAALFLSWAENSSDFYREANSYYQQFKLSGYEGVLNWDSKTPALPVLFAQIAQSPNGPGSNLSQWQNEAEDYFDGLIDSKGGASYTKHGLLYFGDDSRDNSLNPALNAAMIMNRYASMATTDDKRVKYQTFVRSQIDYVLGKNPMSVPYIVGVNPNSPQNPHSAPASGGDDVGNINGDPIVTAHVLYGAVIGGPDKFDNFYDIRSDWPETEVALDYNAPMLTLTAMSILNQTTDPFYVSLQDGAYAAVKPQGLPCDSAFPSACTHPLPKKAQIAMAVVITVVGLAIIGAGFYYFLLTRSQKAQ